MRQRSQSAAGFPSGSTPESLEKGRGLIALLTGAVMFALGLFFGWLLHRERVERALYEDAVRARDRATTTLAETSARLELANRDMIRLRDQLTAAQQQLDGRGSETDVVPPAHADTTDADADDDPGDDVDTAAAPPSDIAAGSGSAAPADAQLFDQLEFDETDADDDITDEIPVVTMPDVSGDGDADRASDDDAPGDVIGDSPAVTESAIDRPPATGIGEPLVVGPIDERASATTPEDVESDDMVGEVPEIDEVDDVAATAAGRAGDVPVRTPIADDDDLRQISGVGPALERLLHEQGIRTFRELALLDESTIAELRVRSPRLANRVQRGAWVTQARRLHVDTYGDEP